MHNLQVYNMTDDAILLVAGKDMRAAREAANVSQELVAGLLSKAGRDWTSKFERGEINVSLCDYLELVEYLRDTLPPEHPALALVTYFKRRRPRS
jgi:transcriptional regulator with XRE-family HTH domain